MLFLTLLRMDLAAEGFFLFVAIFIWFADFLTATWSWVLPPVVGIMPSFTEIPVYIECDTHSKRGSKLWSSYF